MKSRMSKKIAFGLCLLIFFIPVLMLNAAGEQEKKLETSIAVWHRWSGVQNKIFEEIINSFITKNPGIKVENSSIPGQYANLVQKALAQIAAGEDPPDLIAPGYFLLNYSNDTFGGVSIDEIAGAGKNDIYGRFKPAMLDLGKINGVQYAFPMAVSLQTLFYNEEIFKSAGLNPDTPPKTWSQVFETANSIKQKTQKAPLFISTPDSWYMAALIESNGGRMLKDGKAVFNSPEAVEVMTMWRQGYKEGYIPQVSYDESKRAFQAGEIAMHGISIMNLGAIGQTSPWLRVAPMPSFGDKVKHLPAGGAGLMVISRKKEKKQAAWEFLKHIGSREAMDIWVKTGYVSVLKESSPMVDPRQKAAYDQLDYVTQWVNWPGPQGLEAEGIINNWRDKILYGEVSPKEGLDKAVQEINGLIK